MSESTHDIHAVQQDIIDEFALFEDWTERYKYIIDLGRDLPELSADEMIEKNLVKGCQSQVWLMASEEQGKIAYRVNSDAAIVKGLAALLVRVYSAQTADTIIATEPDFISQIGMHEHLSPTRSNGLSAMLKQIKLFAAVIKQRRTSLA
ncbi:MAG: SufE family protein [Gammaproteobacteria bacterium]|nr:SufE family protein [Gammaproteobacteria bacterium]